MFPGASARAPKTRAGKHSPGYSSSSVQGTSFQECWTSVAQEQIEGVCFLSQARTHSGQLTHVGTDLGRALFVIVTAQFS